MLGGDWPSCPREERETVNGEVISVSRSAGHTFVKANGRAVRLLAGLGVEGDAHMGETVKHRSRVRQDPTQPNLRQVHLIHADLHDELRAAGFDVSAGQMDENVTTRGVDLLGLPTGTTLHLGETASVEVTGLRNPCKQLDASCRTSWRPCSTATMRETSSARRASWAPSSRGARCGPGTGCGSSCRQGRTIRSKRSDEDGREPFPPILPDWRRQGMGPVA